MPRENSKGRDRKRTSFGKQQDAEKSFYKKKKSTRSGGFGDERPKRASSGGRSGGFRFDKEEAKSFGERKSSSPFKKRTGFNRGEEGSERPKRFSRDDSKGKTFSGNKFSKPFKKREDSEGGSERPKRFSKSFDKRENFSREEKPKRLRGDEGGSFSKPFAKKGDFKKDFSGDERPKRPRSDEGGSYSKPFGKKPGFKKDYSGDERPKRSGEGSSYPKPFAKRSGFKKDFSGEERPKRFSDEKSGGKFSRPFKKKSFGDSKFGGSDFKKSKFSRDDVKKRGEGEETKSFVERRKEKQREDFQTEKKETVKNDDGLIRLNKFIANSGVGSRREADELIKMGVITVNGVTITEMGHKVKSTDDVRYEGRKLKAEKLVYVLLNKPKGFITTTDDPEERSTVMQLVAGACKERIYPVGRLDRNTTGLLLLTNDGDLADKLTHPSYNAKKIYKAELDKPLTKNDFEKIKEGVQLEEGRAIVDDLASVSDDKKTVGIEIHIGWNRIVRRIFEALGYQVEKLDRVVYAGLDKKDLGRGQWRFLKPEEVVMLKHFSK